jgi:hypothetical protein
MKEEWGIELTSVKTAKEAREYIRLCNVALSRIPMTAAERAAVEFHYKTIPNAKTIYIYVRNLPCSLGSLTSL